MPQNEAPQGVQGTAPLGTGGKSTTPAPQGGKADPSVSAPTGEPAPSQLHHEDIAAARCLERLGRAARVGLNDPELFTEDHQHGTPDGLKAEGLAEARRKLGGIPERAEELAQRLVDKQAAPDEFADDVGELLFCIRRMKDVLDGKPFRGSP